MRLKTFVTLMSVTLLLAACATLPTSPPTTQSVSTAYPPSYFAELTPYPGAGSETEIPGKSAYPPPASPTPPAPVIPPSGYEPQPGDENLKRDTVLLELANSKLEITASQPVEVKAILNGNLSDPCHQLRVVVTPPDANNVINLEVYTLVNAGNACITVIKPFSATIPLGSYTSGQYTVLVNGEKLGEFNGNYAPLPTDDKLTRGEAMVDTTTSTLVITGTQQLEVSAALQGDLPDPCHLLRIKLTPADSQNKINLEVYSVFDPQTICTTVIQPYQVSYPLGSFSSGKYSVYVNGQLLGEFGK